jgi:hypothetical protein
LEGECDGEDEGSDVACLGVELWGGMETDAGIFDSGVDCGVCCEGWISF